MLIYCDVFKDKKLLNLFNALSGALRRYEEESGAILDKAMLREGLQDMLYLALLAKDEKKEVKTNNVIPFKKIERN